MSGPLVHIRNRLRDHIKRQAPGLFRDTDLHFGRLTADEVKKISAFTPACRVGVFGPVRSEILPSGALKLMPRFAAVALTRDGDLLASADEAMGLASSLAALIAAWTPGAEILDGDGEAIVPALVDIGLPEAISIEPAPAGELENEGIALWGCLFTVPVIVGADLAQAEASLPVTLEGLNAYLDIEAAP